MSGIVGYMGQKPAQDILLTCLKRLDYRGYDSAGIALSNGQIIETRKEEGRIEDLEASLFLEPIINGTIGMGHTRWASHGAPTAANSHPLSDSENRFFVVHNGIIENDHTLKKELRLKGHTFKTETDTEVIPHLLAEYDTGDFVTTVQRVIPLLKGAFALVIMSSASPGKMIAISQDNPLILGFGNHEYFLSSDIPALLHYTKTIYPIRNGEFALISSNECLIQTFEGEIVEPKKVTLEFDQEDIGLQTYDHFMLKEIMEQPKAIQATLEGRLYPAHVHLPELEPLFKSYDFKALRKIDIVASGTSYHSGMMGKRVFESMLNIPIEVSLSSEFNSDHGPLDSSHLVIVLSQSGETADTLSALKEAKCSGCTTIAITNYLRRNIARKADYTVLTKAGPELAVPATKAYTAQMTALLLLAISLAEHLDRANKALVPELIHALQGLPAAVETSLIMTEDAIDQFAQVTNDQDHLFLIGKGLDYVLALEGALKLQEVAYLHADAYPAGEMKHGTMALITPGVPVIALATQPHLKEKTVNNIREAKARKAFVVGVTTVGDDEVSDAVDEVLYIPEAHPFLMPIIAAIPLQLLAYYAGTVRGYNVDRPRNLAKSLTVE
ncbi:glutamine--fructose-6-phosphate transaminase (isomerizing) [Pullulanibacillus sp. KACC 23026]|uniref:glutamine--fructose-6-phosphate transaminase (isomerizing) n=1 Tax=Pullulanibacillus sp. KACC 23026 TaxID=3028315 RepID=UPI0023B14552|nr:glutamine--fructose-6-phosphate transaminase (isomerizing) [Pullulanibacillus sp. KACC 23026]WEG12574.1 glutamine--fructose-6-phosphate transaminase (isomerizing) [Pullulanibacillus sp. KACC 23026]